MAAYTLSRGVAVPGLGQVDSWDERMDSENPGPGGFRSAVNPAIALAGVVVLFALGANSALAAKTGFPREAPRWGVLTDVVDLAMKNDQAATFSSVIPSSWLFSSVTRMPS